MSTLLVFCGLLFTLFLFSIAGNLNKLKTAGRSKSQSFFIGCRNGTKDGNCSMSVNAHASGQIKLFFKKEEKKENNYYYDDFGYLIVDGNVPGKSEPIVLDYKKYANTCTSNVYFFFAFQSPEHDKVKKLEKAAKDVSMTETDIAEMISTCPYGITFCYESQLDGPGVRDEYKVTNYIAPKKEYLGLPAHKISLQCMITHNILTSHGFNMAVVTFPGLKREDITGANDFKPDAEKYPDPIRFYVLTLSITKDEYYFLVPKDGRVLLQIGDHKSLQTYLTDSYGNHLPPVKFTIGDKSYGTTTLGENKMPDPYNRKNFKEYIGLWMLYLDFKRKYNELQVVQAVNSEDCNMRVEIRGNRMRKCRSFLQDIVVTEPSDAELDFVYTAEIGIVRKSDDGQENIQEMLKNQEREELKKRTTKETSTNKAEDSRETRNEKITQDIKEKHDSYQKRGQFGLAGNVQLHIPKKPLTTPEPPSSAATPATVKLPKDGSNPTTPPASKAPTTTKPSETKTTQPSTTKKIPSKDSSSTVAPSVTTTKSEGWKSNLASSLVTFLAGGGGDYALSLLLNEGAKAFGSEFLNISTSVVGGIAAVTLSKVDHTSTVGKNVQEAAEMVQEGLVNFKNIYSQVPPPINYENENTKLGEEALKKSNAFIIDAYNSIDLLVTKLDELDKKKESSSPEFKGYLDKLNQANEKFNEMKNRFERNKGTIIIAFASLIGQSYDISTGWITETGQAIANLGNMDDKDDKDKMEMNKMASELQNMLPKDLGGSLGGTFEPIFLSKDELIKLKNMTSEIVLQNLAFLNELKEKNGLKFSLELLALLKDFNFKLPTRINEAMLRIKDSSNLNLNIDEKGALDFVRMHTRQTESSLFQKGFNYTKYYEVMTNGIGNKWKKFLLDKNEMHDNDQSKRHKRNKIHWRAKRDDGGKVGGNGQLNYENKHDTGNSNTNSTENRENNRLSHRAFNDVTKSKSLMESFKKTTGVTNEMSQSEFAQSSLAFIKRERTDVSVSGIPINTKVVVSQLMFECDGNVIQLPKYYYHNGDEFLEGLNENINDNRVRHRATGQKHFKNAKTGAPKKDEKGKETAFQRSMLINGIDEDDKTNQSMIGKLLINGHNNNFTSWENMTLVERVQIDPSFMFKSDEEEE